MNIGPMLLDLMVLLLTPQSVDQKQCHSLYPKGYKDPMDQPLPLVYPAVDRRIEILIDRIPYCDMIYGRAV